MKKFIVACAAVSAITVAAGMSAMAAAQYDSENNAVTFDLPSAKEGTQETILVIPKDKETNITDGDILYINQDADLSNRALLKGTSLEDGTYIVKIGYYDADNEFRIFDNQEFKVGSDTPEPTYTLGDVNADDSINVTDVLWTAQAGAGTRELTADQFKAADVNLDSQINVTDVLWIAQAAAGTRTFN